MAGAQEAARTGDAEQLHTHMAGLKLINKCGILPALDMTIDRDGNTLLHLAALHGHIPCIHGINRYFAKSHSRIRETKQRFVIQPNFEGDTCLHLAARHENPDILRAVYRLFCGELVPGDESNGMEPAEDATDRPDGEKFGPPLVFLKTKNATGRDAAAEARAFGRDANARWCDEVVSRLDPEAKHQSPEELRRLSEYVGVLLGISPE